MTKKGFYLMGSFYKGKKAVFYYDTIKPFTIDAKRGEVFPKVIHFFENNLTFNEWFYIEDSLMSDLKREGTLRNFCNLVWEDWCKKHKRMYKPVFTD